MKMFGNKAVASKKRRESHDVEFGADGIIQKLMDVLSRGPSFAAEFRRQEAVKLIAVQWHVDEEISDRPIRAPVRSLIGVVQRDEPGIETMAGLLRIKI